MGLGLLVLGGRCFGGLMSESGAIYRALAALARAEGFRLGVDRRHVSTLD